MNDAKAGVFLNDSRDFRSWILELLTKITLQPAMNVDGKPILLIRIARGERI